MIALFIGLGGFVDDSEPPPTSPVAFNHAEAKLPPLPDLAAKPRALCVTETLVYRASRDEPLADDAAELRQNMEKACAIWKDGWSRLRKLQLKQDLH